MPKRLLPLIPPGLAVVQVLPTPERLTIVAQPRTPTASCPECGTTSAKVHSRYERRLHDLPWQGRAVALHVRARRFRCCLVSCRRLTFSERLPGVAPAAARRTDRLSGLHGCLGAALGGEAGARLAGRLAIATSPDTLLRAILIQAGSAPLAPTPRVLGVDDYAWRRGRRYGTVLVDLERGRVVDLLPDRQAGTLAAWLRARPGVEVIARDRAGAYADGARQGAPGAVQVADRWHMLRNLGDAMHVLADRHGAAVRRVARQVAEERAGQHAAALPAPPPPEPAARFPTAAERAKAARFARRQARYEEAARLRGQGASLRRIAALLDVERVTVRSWFARGGAAAWAKPRRGSALDPHAPLLERRWAEGCRNATQLWREAAAAGYRGRPGTVRTWAVQRRAGQSRAAVTGAPHALRSAAPPSGRRVGRWLMADDGGLGADERRFVARLLAEAPELAEAVAVAKRLRAVLRRSGDETLTAVLDAARGTLLGSFAAWLERDRDAVQAALDLPWTTSPVEGQVNRLKTIKRAMYGRAGFDLLRARVLRAA